MRQLIINDRTITEDEHFIVAEIGSNHCGDLDLAKQMIETASKCGADAVKFQKRDNPRMFTKKMLESPYNNEYSLGSTYGEHREKLDWFGKKEFVELQAIAQKFGVLMFATPFEEDSADFLHDLNMPLYKIASCDLTNVPLLKHVAVFHKPMLISMGGATMEDIDRAYETVRMYHNNFAFLYCVSSYPNRDEDLNLCQIGELRNRYPDTVIGFSSHHSGLDPLKEAFFLGARVLEVHFTLNRGFRGTDHGFSLEPHGLATLCEDIKRIKVRFGSKEHPILGKDGFIYKMGKAIHVARPIQAGHRIEPEDIVIKSPAEGLPPYEDVIGRVALTDLSTADTLTREVLK